MATDAQPEAKQSIKVYLQPETKQALKEYAERTKAESMSAAADELIRGGVTAASAQSMGELAAPALVDALGRRVADELTAATQPLHDEIAALRAAVTAAHDAVKASHKEAALAHLEIFAYFGQDYGFEEAQRIEGVAILGAERAIVRGEIARLDLRVSEVEGQVA
jgi:hypothetical protein